MIYVRKSTGEKERFSPEKFALSLKKAGANEKTINRIVDQIEEDRPKSTLEIHQIATRLLQKYEPPVADRYNLKKALMELGPSGYPFEHFVAQLFTKLGYKTKVGTVIPGYCVQHEVDVIAQDNAQHIIIECKFHNRRGLKTNVKTTLYVQARFEDIHDAWRKQQDPLQEIHEVWVVTNTQFTTQAIQYALCKKMRLLSWSYPHNNHLASLIAQTDLFPITTLTSLSKKEKKAFIQKGLVLCKDAPLHKKMLGELGLTSQQINKIINEAVAVCKLNEQ